MDSTILKNKIINLSETILFSKYLLVGLMNTIVGYGIIFSLMYVGVSPEVSNIIGYAIGITVSYVLNKIYTFKSKAHPKKEFPKFVASLLAAYGLNFVTLVICVRILHINAYVSQIISGAVYTLSGFVFVRYFAFKGED
ncbi:MAG: GtrA family protein [Candidatus Parvarchaeota archaeon]